VANVIPLRQPSIKNGPFDVIRDMQDLYARLIEVNDATRSLVQRLEIAQPEGNAVDALARASGELERVADQVLDAIASAIVHQTANMVVPADLYPDMPDETDTRP
jgi:hypothetical protein